MSTSPQSKSTVEPDKLGEKETGLYMKELSPGDCPKDAVEYVVKDDIEVIARHAFHDCVSLKTIKFPDSIKRINGCAFWNCLSLQKIDLPPNLELLGSGAFKNCASLKKIVLPSLLKHIDARVFSKCGSLEEVIIEGPISLIPMECFDNCCRLKRVVLPQFTKSKEKGAPKPIKSIEKHAFRNCASLLKLYLPNSIKKIHKTAFQGCFKIVFENFENISSFETVEREVVETIVDQVDDKLCEEKVVERTRTVKKWVDIKQPFTPCDLHKDNPWHKNEDGTYRYISRAKNAIGGRTQKGCGPEMSGITLSQLMNLKEHPLYHRTGKDGKNDYLMRDFIQLIKLITAGTGMGYSLLRNKENPLKVEVMVSHALDEPIKDFVEAIEQSGLEGPFWIDALSINWNDDNTIGTGSRNWFCDNAEPNSETGFAAVLKSVSLMIVVVTHVCDINTRLWCIYEMHLAICKGVPLKLCAYISPDDLKHGRLHEDTCVVSAKFNVDSSAARCGNPKEPESLDEIMIRKVIDKSVNGFKGVNEAVENSRLSYLAKYPIDQVVPYKKSGAICQIKEAIECIILRTSGINELKTYDQYYTTEKKKYDDDKSFEAWIGYIQAKLMPRK